MKIFSVLIFRILVTNQFEELVPPKTRIWCPTCIALWPMRWVVSGRPTHKQLFKLTTLSYIIIDKMKSLLMKIVMTIIKKHKKSEKTYFLIRPYKMLYNQILIIEFSTMVRYLQQLLIYTSLQYLSALIIDITLAILPYTFLNFAASYYTSPINLNSKNTIKFK